MKTAILSLVSFAVFLGMLGYKDQLVKEYNEQFRVYQVDQVVEQARALEQLQSFKVTGIVGQGWGIPSLIKVFPLTDPRSDELILIIPKTRTLPKVTNQPTVLKVQVYAQPLFFGEDILILKEVN